MSKLRVWGTLVTSVLFAAVAVFPNIGQALSSNQASLKAVAHESGNTGVLVVDGGDPFPPPPNPVPWPTQAA